MQSKDLEALDGMPFNFFAKDEQGRYLWVNQACLKLAGLSSRDEMIGKTDHDMVWADDAESFLKTEREILKTGKTANLKEHADKSAVGAVTAYTCKFAGELDGKKCVFGAAIFPD